MTHSFEAFDRDSREPGGAKAVTHTRIVACFCSHGRYFAVRRPCLIRITADSRWCKAIREEYPCAGSPPGP